MTRTPSSIWAEYRHAQGQLLVVTGEIGTGKTTWCHDLVAYARQEDSDVAGLLSLGVFANNQKQAIDLLDLRTDVRRRLATRRTAPDNTTPTPNWQFDAATLAWGDTVLQAIPHCDLLVIDELGPLELVRQQGWQHAFPLLQRRAYRLACVVVRQSLLHVFLGIFVDAAVLKLAHSAL